MSWSVAHSVGYRVDLVGNYRIVEGIPHSLQSVELLFIRTKDIIFRLLPNWLVLLVNLE